MATELLRLVWQRDLSVDERSARRLLHAAGEAAARKDEGATQLLQELRDAMFGDGRNALRQRGHRCRPTPRPTPPLSPPSFAVHHLHPS